MLERGERRADDVADVDVVAGLAPVAEDPRRLAVREQAEEDRDDAGFAVGILARPVYVAEAQGDPVAVRAAASYVSRYSSPASFDAPYGERGWRGSSSRAGRSHSP